MGPGGSVANAIYAAQGFGCNNYFAGLVAQDAVGSEFQSELARAGIETIPPSSHTNLPSGQCLVLVTPDGQRSMNTCLGISDSIGVHDVQEECIASSDWVFIEGYLTSAGSAKAAAQQTREVAEQYGVKTCLALSEVSIVRAFRPALEEVIGNGLDLVFCNMAEASEWFQTNSLDEVSNRYRELAKCLVVTDSEKGCYVVYQDQRNYIPGFPVQAVDSNGAGDMFAGAFLASVQQEATMLQAARFANFAASHVVSKFGPRLDSQQAYSDIAHRYR